MSNIALSGVNFIGEIVSSVVDSGLQIWGGGGDGHPDPEIGGGGGGWSKKAFFRFFKPQFGLTIRGFSPGSANELIRALISTFTSIQLCSHRNVIVIRDRSDPDVRCYDWWIKVSGCNSVLICVAVEYLTQAQK